MMRMPKETRLEVKFVAPAWNFSAMEHWLCMHPMGFYRPFPDRWVQNVYFDSHDYAAYADNIMGASNRAKLRYRWYGFEPYPDDGTLEIKRKRNLFGWKLRFAVTQKPYRTGSRWRSVRAEIRRQLPIEWRLWLDANPIVVFINQYYRRYLVSSDHRIRITLDTRQSVWDQRFTPYPSFDRRANLEDTVVIECKFNRDDYAHATAMLFSIPVRMSRHSKYINAINAIRNR